MSHFQSKQNWKSTSSSSNPYGRNITPRFSECNPIPCRQRWGGLNPEWNQSANVVDSGECESLSMDSLLTCMGVEDQDLRIIGERQLSPIHESNYKATKRFNVFIWKKLSPEVIKRDARCRSSVQFLKKFYKESVMTNSLKAIFSTNSSLMMISILGYYCEKRPSRFEVNSTFECIGSLLCFMENSNVFISHVAVANTNFSAQNFGRGCDGKAFRGRGLAQFMVGVCQYFVKKEFQSDVLYCLPNFDSRFKNFCENIFWYKLGFKECELPAQSTILSSLSATMSGSFMESIGRVLVLHHPVEKFYLGFILDNMGSHLEKNVCELEKKSTSTSTSTSTLCSREDKNSNSTENPLQEKLYSLQLSRTTIMFRDVPVEVLNHRWDEELITEAIKHALDIVKSSIDKDKDCDEEDCSVGIDNDDLSFDSVKEKRTNGIFDQVEMFMKSLTSNLVYDMGFRNKRRDQNLCWCPW
jgi:hypothetical protein